LVSADGMCYVKLCYTVNRYNIIVIHIIVRHRYRSCVRAQKLSPVGGRDWDNAPMHLNAQTRHTSNLRLGLGSLKLYKAMILECEIWRADEVIIVLSPSIRHSGYIAGRILSIFSNVFKWLGLDYLYKFYTVLCPSFGLS